MVDKVVIPIDGDSSGYQKAAKDAQDSTDEVGKSVLNLKSPWLAVGAAVAGVGVALKSAVQTAARFEDIGVSFRVLTGDAEKAEDALTSLEEFASGTPFTFDQVAQAGKTLLAFGFEVNELNTLLGQTGDVAAATGNSLQEIALIYGQVAAAGKLTGERLLQLRERGINVGPAIAEALGTSEKAVADLVSKGKVSFEVFEDAFASLSREGGIAFGGLELKSETLNGKLSTLSDNWDQLSKGIGNLFLPVAKDAVDLLTTLTREAANLFKDDTAQQRAGKLVDEITALNEEIKALQENQAREGIAGFFTDKKLGAELIEKAQSRVAELNAELDKLAAKELEGEDAAAGEDAAQQIANKKKLNEALLDLDREFATLSAEERQARIEEINAINEEERNRKIEEKALELESEGRFEEALALIRDAARKKELIALQNQAKAEAKIKKVSEDQKRAILQSSLAQIATLQQSENRAAIIVGKAAGIANATISTQVGAAKALELGPILGPPLAAAVVAAGAINIAKIAGVKGLQEGGVIGAAGSLGGARKGNDDSLVAVRTGEMVLTGEDQAQLLESIRGGELGGSDIEEIRIVLDAGAFTDAFEAEIVTRSREDRTPIATR